MPRGVLAAVYIVMILEEATKAVKRMVTSSERIRRTNKAVLAVTTEGMSEPNLPEVKEILYTKAIVNTTHTAVIKASS